MRTCSPGASCWSHPARPRVPGHGRAGRRGGTPKDCPFCPARSTRHRPRSSAPATAAPGRTGLACTGLPEPFPSSGPTPPPARPARDEVIVLSPSHVHSFGELTDAEALEVMTVLRGGRCSCRGRPFPRPGPDQSRTGRGSLDRTSARAAARARPRAAGRRRPQARFALVLNRGRHRPRRRRPARDLVVDRDGDGRPRRRRPGARGGRRRRLTCASWSPPPGPTSKGRGRVLAAVTRTLRLVRRSPSTSANRPTTWSCTARRPGCDALVVG